MILWQSHAVVNTINKNIAITNPPAKNGVYGIYPILIYGGRLVQQWTSQHQSSSSAVAADDDDVVLSA